MYVCLCNPTTDKQIIECSQDGCTLPELKRNLNICQDCRCCAQEIKEIYNKSKIND